MNATWEVIYQYAPSALDSATVVIRPVTKLVTGKITAGSKLNRSYGLTFSQILGITFLALGLGGFIGPLIPALRLEAAYALLQANKTPQANTELEDVTNPPPTGFGQLLGATASTSVIKTPLLAPDGAVITPHNLDFSIIIPAIGVNAPVIANVDPASPGTYGTALMAGVAQASTSFTPDQNGTTYLFSHSTNYDWFVNDLNAVFYLLKNLKAGDTIALYYKGKQYTYKITETKVVHPRDISYLVPVVGKKGLILQTCWPPGSTTERLLVFAEFVREQ